MQRTIDETERRRAKQITYNEEYKITPRSMAKSKEEIMSQRSILDVRAPKKAYLEPQDRGLLVADPVIEYLGKDQLEKLIMETEKKMKAAAKDLDFISAAQYRDELFALKKKISR
jgi:excinuclease ABC subunit B